MGQLQNPSVHALGLELDLKNSLDRKGESAHKQVAELPKKKQQLTLNDTQCYSSPNLKSNPNLTII